MPFWWAKARKKAIYFQSDTSKAGLKPGDVITSVNGKPTATVDDLTSVVSELKPQTTVSLAVVTQSGDRKTLHLKLGEFPGG